MKYILKESNGSRDLEFAISEKTDQYIEGDVYNVFGDGKTEPYHYSYICTVNLRYEGIIKIEHGRKNKNTVRISGPNGMISHMRVQGFLAQIALLESKDRTYYTADFKSVLDTGILNDCTVEFLENETFVPSRCKSCACFKDFKCIRKSLYSNEIGVCWFEEEY